jgi:hypothetical protein
MKKTLILALALAAGTASASPYYLPTGRYTDDLPARRSVDKPTGFECPPPPVYPYGIEIGAAYSHMINGLKVDTYGVDITGIHNIDSNLSVNLRFSMGFGNDKYGAVDDWYDMDVTTITLTAGVRYTDSINDSTSWYIGANVGYGYTKVDETWTDTYESDGHEWETGGVSRTESESYSISKSGVVFGAEIGLRHNISDTVYLYSAAQLWGSTAKASTSSVQYGVGVRAGIGVSF